jgi:hypothetical protein
LPFEGVVQLPGQVYLLLQRVPVSVPAVQEVEVLPLDSDAFRLEVLVVLRVVAFVREQVEGSWVLALIAFLEDLVTFGFSQAR